MRYRRAPRLFLNLSRIRKSNNINLFCGVPRTLGPFRFLLGSPLAFALAVDPAALTARVQVSLSPLMAYTRGKGTRYESYNGKAAALAFEIY